jgi:hypothetical protein
MLNFAAATGRSRLDLYDLDYGEMAFMARANFRVVIIKPEIMESVDLSDPAKARRQVYKFDESSGQWTHTECWP